MHLSQITARNSSAHWITVSILYQQLHIFTFCAKSASCYSYIILLCRVMLCFSKRGKPCTQRDTDWLLFDCSNSHNLCMAGNLHQILPQRRIELNENPLSSVFVWRVGIIPKTLKTRINTGFLRFEKASWQRFGNNFRLFIKKS